MPLRYRQQRLLKDGGSAVFAAHGKGPDSLLMPGDTAFVTYDYTAPTDVPLVESKGTFVVLLGPEPWRYRDNVLLDFTVENSWRSGVIRRARLDFTPDSAVASGRVDIHGLFSLSLEYDDGGTGEVTAAYRNARFEVTLREDRRGVRKSFRLVFDSRGRLLEREVLTP
jgi:hypothetical protein